jgi:hypothetical protein
MKGAEQIIQIQFCKMKLNFIVFYQGTINCSISAPIEAFYSPQLHSSWNQVLRQAYGVLEAPNAELD